MGVSASAGAVVKQVAAEATLILARYWWAEAEKIAEQVDDPAARWEILTTALRRVGWTDAGEPR